MRKLICLLILLSVVAVACAPSSAINSEPTAVSQTVEPAVTRPALNPVTPTADEGDPVPPLAAELPTDYPETAVIAPSGEIDLGELTPAADTGAIQIAPSPGRPAITPSPQLARLAAAIARDLTRRFDVSAEAIHLVSAVPVVWPSTALGCPAEGVTYADVTVEGALVTLEAAGETYTYHTGGGNFVLCAAGQPLSTGSVTEEETTDSTD
jgi:hypothetical protein